MYACIAYVDGDRRGHRVAETAHHLDGGSGRSVLEHNLETRKVAVELFEVRQKGCLRVQDANVVRVIARDLAVNV